MGRPCHGAGCRRGADARPGRRRLGRVGAGVLLPRPQRLRRPPSPVERRRGRPRGCGAGGHRPPRRAAQVRGRGMRLRSRRSRGHGQARALVPPVLGLRGVLQGAHDAGHARRPHPRPARGCLDGHRQLGVRQARRRAQDSLDAGAEPTAAGALLGDPLGAQRLELELRGGPAQRRPPPLPRGGDGARLGAVLQRPVGERQARSADRGEPRHRAVLGQPSGSGRVVERQLEHR
mmetsp:Transcript_78329/g.227247  ORF Transcript_78329/g.227247 Transcript_78329/m.227247 type:complete len:233 (+) Transcript_78329:347-1045(+)